LLIAMAAPALAQTSPSPTDALTGCWSGSAVLFDTSLAAKAGPIDVSLQFYRSKLVTGTIGQAAIDQGEVRTHRDIFQPNGSSSVAPAA
jgi:hypothetical protein